MSTSKGSGDPAWKYCKKVDPKQANKVSCNFCGKITAGGITRAKHHFVGGNRNVTVCQACPETVKEEIRQYMVQKDELKSHRVLVSDYEDYDLMEDETEDEIAQSAVDKSKKKKAESTSSTQGSSKPPLAKRSRQKGPMDSYFTPDPEMVVQSRKNAKGKQTTMNEHYKKEARDKACQSIARWMYDAGIPFNAVNYDSFQVMIEAIGQYGPGMKGPSYHEVRVPLLDKEIARTNDLMKAYKEQWAKVGCSVMADGWKDRRERTLINFLVNSPRGTVFIESLDASEYVKTGQKMFELLDKFVQKIGPANVVQVVTDSASNNVYAGKLLEATYPHLYWTPCAAHCLDLMLEDIWKIPKLNMTMKKAVALSGFIYNHTGVLNMMRRFTKQRELLRPAKTRFATAFITLSSIHQQKNCLKKMFSSDDWTRSKWAKEAQGKKVAQIVMGETFWKNVVYSLKLAGPLIKVLRIVDGERKPPMGYIYEAMDRAKEAIAKTFNDKEEKYQEAFQIIDRRWEVQLHRPLHAAGYYLNPEFFYTNPNIENDKEVNLGLIQCIQRLVPDTNIQDKISDELSIYKNAEGLFGVDMAKRARVTKAPAEWWSTYGSGAPNLQAFAIKVLGLTCSASGCERNWSVFENLHTKRRNRLAQQKLNDLVFIKYNRALKRRYDIRDQIDPISLKDIDDSNEWLLGRIDEELEEEDDYVFDENDGLTWSVVARASGAEEPTRPVRRRSTPTPTPTSTSRGKRPIGTSINIDDEEEMATSESEDEEDCEGLDDICGGDDMALDMASSDEDEF